MQRVQRRRTRGSRLPATAIYVGRPTPWGNPYHVDPAHPTAALLEFTIYAVSRLRRDPAWLQPLRGHDLACWCPLDRACHADILLALLAASDA